MLFAGISPDTHVVFGGLCDLLYVTTCEVKVQHTYIHTTPTEFTAASVTRAG